MQPAFKFFANILEITYGDLFQLRTSTFGGYDLQTNDLIDRRSTRKTIIFLEKILWWAPFLGSGETNLKIFLPAALT